jgi:putative SOS response-associated peptidase YedK
MINKTTFAPPKFSTITAIERAEDRDAWLMGTRVEAKAVLKTYPSDLMVAYEVGTPVNSLKNKFT